MQYTRDEDNGLWYFGDGNGESCRTESVTGTVNIDWDHYGNIIGVELIQAADD